MELVFLGTSAMVPTKERNHSSVLLSYGSEGLLFDCGEGTQRQLRLAGIKPTKISKVLISHWHGDHVLGLPGLFQTLAASDYSNTLEVYGPKGTKERFKHLLSAFAFDSTKLKHRIFEVEKGVFYKNNDFHIEALPLEHNTPCIGFRFVEEDRRKIRLSFTKKLGIPEGPLLGKLQQNKSIRWKGKLVKPEQATYVVEGKKIAYVADTLPCNNAYELAKNTDILICEATYASSLSEKSEKYFHMTAKDAALLASRANARLLVLTHFSQRYKDLAEIEQEAKTYFNNVVCAYDFMKVKV